ncbi:MULTISPECIES: FAD-dependent oxidoreductase [Micrococcaceae]|uniref:FAD-dependent oxidoreductase n=1 Tax=Micrococcaceae TaxID=1268 RepID=UPI0012FC0265|nr:MULTISPECIES: FAD-dependent oxidoreductase [unclassified Pseudarthrobacter]MEA3549007.1 FAD-dependent oxidoreductase [Pseudarthrobacter sp. C1]MUU70322.1 pyridine nucleotide-disulfide oxidoreductase [Pseudarthrobacter sp. GA104]HET7781732.1 FAD-dependent oxidoreductase [Arthrobacter sp.]
MSAPAPSTSAAPATRIVIAGAGPAAQALVSQLDRARFTGTITVLSNRDDTPAELLELAMLPQVSVRFGQPASHIDAANRTVATADGMEFAYDQLVIATGSAPVASPVEGAGQCLSYSTIDDAARVGEAVSQVARELGRRPLGILVGTGAAAGQAEAVLRARGVRPIRTTARPASVIPAPSTSGFAASGVVFEDGSSMYGDLVVLAEERESRDDLAASAGLETAATGGIVISHDFRTSVPGIWALGDAAAFDGVRLGLLVAAASAAGACATQLLTAA